MKVTNKQEDQLCNRTLVTLQADNKVTPSNAEFIQTIVADMKCDESLVVMKKVDTNFGAPGCTATAYVYKDAASKLKFERKTKHMKEAEKKAAEEAKKAAEEAKAAKEAEAPAEAPKEVAPAKPAEAPKEAPAEKPAEEKPAEAPAEKPAEEKPAEAQ